MYAEAIQQAVIQTYLNPLDRIIERKAKIFSALSARDPFAMTDEEAAQHQRRLREIGEETELLGHLRTAISDLHDTYNQRLSEAERAIAALQHDIQQLGLDYATFRQLFQSEARITDELITILQSTIRKKAA